MKRCSYCNYQIKDLAKKCRYCHKRLNEFPHITDNMNDIANKRKEFLTLENKLLTVSSIILGLAIIWFGGYGFYLFVKLVIFIIMIYLFVKYWKQSHTDEYRLWLFGLTAFIYNPIFYIYLNRPLRTIIDIVLIVLFIKSIKHNKTHIKNLE